MPHIDLPAKRDNRGPPSVWPIAIAVVLVVAVLAATHFPVDVHADNFSMTYNKVKVEAQRVGFKLGRD